MNALTKLSFHSSTLLPGLHNLPGLIAAVFPSVSDAPIRLQGKAIDHVFESPNEIISSVKNYYVNETLKQVYKIIGSLDFVGNPTILFSSFVSGVRDLVVAPTKALMKSPTNLKQFGIGVGKGSISLFSHSASGIFGFSARLWATAGQAVAILSLDPEFRQWHRDRVVNEASNLNRVWKRRGVQSLQEIVLRPVADVLLGVSMGATGFITAPYQGAKKGGSRGFVRGVAVGTVGVVAKPVVGVFDAFTHASQTIHDIAKSVNVLERRYQPALKLRLPYVFGPMNILTPFDSISARSVYLLTIFPPKTKLKRRIHKGKEIHVHSEVLNMEPGVETFAILTTIRVVLIKVRREGNNNVLAPSFGWEVDLSSTAKVSSQIADHGHNGVALTITKRAPSRERGRRNSTEPKRDKQKNLENTMRSHASSMNTSSAISDDSSAFSEVEEEIFDADDVGDDLQAEEIIDEKQTQAVETLAQTAAEAEYHHGATREGGEILEWFTVLAEYQHRKQLTRLHNAISCVVGDYDAVISDRMNVHNTGDKAGVNTFGIFNFESGLPDSQTVQLSNMELVSNLEYLHWMQQTLFERVRAVPAQRRGDYLHRIRRNWGYSKDLEASVALGGPAWLIQARATAMYIPHNNQISGSFDAEDTAGLQEVISGVLDEGTVRSERALELVKRAKKESDGGSSTIENSQRGSVSKLSFSLRQDANRTLDSSSEKIIAKDEESLQHKSEIDEVDSVKENEEDEEKQEEEDVSVQLPSAPPRGNLRDRMRYKDSDGDMFFSIRNLGAEIAQMDDDSSTQEEDFHHHGHDHGTTFTDLSDEASFEQTQQDKGIVQEQTKVTGFADSDAVVGNESQEHTQRSFRSDGEVFTTRKKDAKVKFTPSKHQSRSVQSFEPSVDSDHSSRIDRLEAVMEQLIILNANQAQQRQQQLLPAAAIPTEVRSQNSSSAQDIADTLKHELAEIREKMEVRAKEDEELRSEIIMLRDQLADRRSKAKKKEEAATKSRRKFSVPVPEIKLKTMMLPRRSSNDGRVTDYCCTTIAAAAAAATTSIDKWWWRQ